MLFGKEFFNAKSSRSLDCIVLGLVLAAGLWAEPPWAQQPSKTARGFQAYWMGIDPLDGGDSRRKLLQLNKGRFAMAGRDTVLTLCAPTPARRWFCVRYEPAGNGVMIEHTTRQDGTPVSRIVFHKVSHD
jgi:hypothetical protein